MTLLDVQAVSKAYGSVTALEAVSLRVAAGSRTAVVGPSGSGKTTLLRLIAGFEAPDAGRIVLEGAAVAEGGRAVPAHLRGIGFVPQDGALFPHLTVAGNIGFGLPAGPERRRRIGELLEMVELDAGMAERRPHELSGGQQQRVALARALARRPRLMLLDEPFSALDAGLRAAMRKAVAEVLRAAGITAILVTHDQGEALSFADQVAVMRCGRLVQAGAPRDLYLHPADEGIAAFLGEAIVLPATLGDGWATCALGRLATGRPGLSGQGRILVRPEQVRLEPGQGGTVVEVEFGGAVCLVSLELTDGTRLAVPGASLDLPAVGTPVSVSVAGAVHVF